MGVNERWQRLQDVNAELRRIHAKIRQLHLDGKTPSPEDITRRDQLKKLSRNLQLASKPLEDSMNNPA